MKSDLPTVFCKKMALRFRFVYLKSASCRVSQNKGHPLLQPTLMWRLKLYLCYMSDFYSIKVTVEDGWVWKEQTGKGRKIPEMER